MIRPPGGLGRSAEPTHREKLGSAESGGILADWVILGIGVLAAAVGGELFVRGAAGIAAWSRVPPGIIGATVAAFGTSTPELSTALNAATAGRPEVSFGDVLGSNIANIALVLGLAILFLPMAVRRQDVRRDVPFALAAPVIIGLLLSDGRLGRVDGGVLLTVFAAWLTISVIEARQARSATTKVIGEPGPHRAAVKALTGLVLLVAAGRLVVLAAEGIANDLGVDGFFIGATMVAIGTSAPEVAATTIASLRGHSEIALGMLVGSNNFNSLFIVGVIALISPFRVDGGEVGVALVAGALAMLLAIPGPAGRLERTRGMTLVASYVAYAGALMLAV